MKRISPFLLAIVASIVVISCKKKNVEPAPSPNLTGSLVLKFDNLVGTQILRMGQNYTNPTTDESFRVTALRYFISNIKLKKADGSEYVVPQEESYFLVNEEVAGSKRLSVQVPEDDYIGVTFMIGVDSLRNTMPSDKRKGALDISGQAQGMYWTWNSGYIFFFLEGESDQVVDDDAFRYHIGFFGGFSSPTLNNLRTTTLSFKGDKAIVRKDKTPEVHIMLDLLKVFNGENFQLKISENSEIMFSATSAKVADNIKEAFFYDHIHN
jgi:hypothetical protein